ncbi:MAG: hypothetical protein ACRYGO_12085 [Janthinobacterium lividum]
MKQELVVVFGVIGASLLWAGWREYRNANRQDGKSLVASALVFAAGAAAAALGL